MPYLRVETNVATDKIPADLPAKLCSIISKSLGKPINVSNFFIVFIDNKQCQLC